MSPPEPRPRPAEPAPAPEASGRPHYRFASPEDKQRAEDAAWAARLATGPAAGLADSAPAGESHRRPGGSGASPAAAAQASRPGAGEAPSSRPASRSVATPTVLVRTGVHTVSVESVAEGGDEEPRDEGRSAASGAAPAPAEMLPGELPGPQPGQGPAEPAAQPSARKYRILTKTEKISIALRNAQASQSPRPAPAPGRPDKDGRVFRVVRKQDLIDEFRRSQINAAGSAGAGANRAPSPPDSPLDGEPPHLPRSLQSSAYRSPGHAQPVDIRSSQGVDPSPVSERRGAPDPVATSRLLDLLQAKIAGQQGQQGQPGQSVPYAPYSRPGALYQAPGGPSSGPSGSANAANAADAAAASASARASASAAARASAAAVADVVRGLREQNQLRRTARGQDRSNSLLSSGVERPAPPAPAPAPRPANFDAMLDGLSRVLPGAYGLSPEPRRQIPRESALTRSDLATRPRKRKISFPVISKAHIRAVSEEARARRERIELSLSETCYLGSCAKKARLTQKEIVDAVSLDVLTSLIASVAGELTAAFEDIIIDQSKEAAARMPSSTFGDPDFEVLYGSEVGSASAVNRTGF